MPNGGEHYERLAVCSFCQSPNIRIRRQRHRHMLWRCRNCNRVFSTPDLAEYLTLAGDDKRGYVFAESIPEMEQRGRLRKTRGARHSRRSRVSRKVAVIATIILIGAVGFIVFMSGLGRDSDRPDQFPVLDDSPTATDSQPPTPMTTSPSTNTPTPSLPTTAEIAQGNIAAAIPTDTPVVIQTNTPTRTPEPTAVPPTSSPLTSATPSVTVLTAFENGSWLIQNRPTLATSIVAVDWIADGVEASESETVQELMHLAAFHEMLTASLIDLPWFADDFAETEVEALEYFRYLASDSATAASLIMEMPWFVDGINELDVRIIDNLSYVAQNNASEAERIVRMPFLTAIEPVDVSVMESLADLASFQEAEFSQVMAHPSLARDITDDLTPIVAMLYGVATTNATLIDRLLDSSRVDIERRSITLPLTGEVDLSIVRTAPGAVRSMNLLEHSVRLAEELMGKALPTRFVGLLYEESVTGDYAGNNFGTHIVILPKYDVDDGSFHAEFAPGNIAHEVAHYYWRGNSDWIDEGVAEFMTYALENRRTGEPIRVANDPCAHARSIIELEALGPDPDADYDVFGCNYSLGVRLFVDMYRTLGEDEMWRGLRDLHDKSLVEDGGTKGTSLDVKHLREVFQPDPDALASIGRWYDGSQDYDLSHLDLRPANPTLPSINGRIDEAYINIGEDGPRVSSFSVRDAADETVWLNLDYSYNVAGEPRKLVLDLVEFYEDGFEFNRGSVEITAESQYVGGESYAVVGSDEWAPGWYWVHLYDGDRKVADVQYEVTP